MPTEIEKKLEENLQTIPYNPSVEESLIQKYVDKRVSAMKTYRVNLKVEKDWLDSDKEYVPSEISLTQKKRLEQNQDTGLRSKLVTVSGDEDSWRSSISDGVLLSKIQSAISIIIDRDPSAAMTALVKKFEKTSFLMNGLWKRNWKVAKGKQILKLFAFDLAK